MVNYHLFVLHSPIIVAVFAIHGNESSISPPTLSITYETWAIFKCLLLIIVSDELSLRGISMILEAFFTTRAAYTRHASVAYDVEIFSPRHIVVAISASPLIL